MKKLFIALIAFAVSSVSAQELFPEFAAYERITDETENAVSPSTENAVVTEMTENELLVDDAIPPVSETDEVAVTDAVADVNETDLFAESPTEPAAVDAEATPDEKEAEEDEEEEDKKIVIYMKTAKARIMPQKAFSYCDGTIAVTNPFKKPIQQLDFTLNYGGFDTPYKVRNLAPQQEKEESIVLVDEACDYIMGMPKMEVTRCVVENMTEKNCIKRVVFLPLSE